MQPAPFIQLMPLSIDNPAFKAAEREIAAEWAYRDWAHAGMEGREPEPLPPYRFRKRTDSLTAPLALDA
jgi:hypothetical protein